jgi:ribosomal protein S18 acetylase RimI-like enzyme
MAFEIVPAHEISLTEQARIFTDAFHAYLIGSITGDEPGLARFLCAQGADFYYSRFVRTGANDLAGFGYINRTGNVSRLASMGIVPVARRSGAAAFLLSHLLDEAKTRGDETMMLECFEQNEPALALYRRHKFKEVGRLFGWRRKSGGGGISRSNKLEELPLLQATLMRTPSDYPELPWQISRFAVAKIPAGRAFRVDPGCVVIGSPELSPIRIHAFGGSDKNDWNPLRNVLGAVLAKFRGREFFAPQIFPEPFGTEIFQPLGFKREPLNQFLMRREL